MSTELHFVIARFVWVSARSACCNYLISVVRKVRRRLCLVCAVLARSRVVCRVTPHREPWQKAGAFPAWPRESVPSLRPRGCVRAAARLACLPREPCSTLLNKYTMTIRQQPSFGCSEWQAANMMAFGFSSSIWQERDRRRRTSTFTSSRRECGLLAYACVLFILCVLGLGASGKWKHPHMCRSSFSESFLQSVAFQPAFQFLG